MVAPLVVAGLGGLALSGGANLYAQHTSRALYRRQIDAYTNGCAEWKRGTTGTTIGRSVCKSTRISKHSKQNGVRRHT